MPGYKAYPQWFTAEPSWRCSVISPGGEYFDYQAKCGQGYSGILVFPMGGGAPECKDFHPLSKSGLSEFTEGETY